MHMKRNKCQKDNKKHILTSLQIKSQYQQLPIVLFLYHSPPLAFIVWSPCFRLFCVPFVLLTLAISCFLTAFFLFEWFVIRSFSHSLFRFLYVLTFALCF